MMPMLLNLGNMGKWYGWIVKYVSAFFSSYGFAEHENGLVLKMNGFSDKLAVCDEECIILDWEYRVVHCDLAVVWHNNRLLYTFHM